MHNQMQRGIKMGISYDMLYMSYIQLYIAGFSFDLDTKNSIAHGNLSQPPFTLSPPKQRHSLIAEVSPAYTSFPVPGYTIYRADCHLAVRGRCVQRPEWYWLGCMGGYAIKRYTTAVSFALSGILPCLPGVQNSIRLPP